MLVLTSSICSRVHGTKRTRAGPQDPSGPSPRGPAPPPPWQKPAPCWSPRGAEGWIWVAVHFPSLTERISKIVTLPLEYTFIPANVPKLRPHQNTPVIVCRLLAASLPGSVFSISRPRAIGSISSHFKNNASGPVTVQTRAGLGE